MSEVRLIDANALGKELERAYLKKEVDEVGEEAYKAVAHIYSTILCMPTVDAEPIRHAHWNLVVERVGGGYCSCSHCNYHTLECVNYCQNCGAKMDEVTE